MEIKPFFLFFNDFNKVITAYENQAKSTEGIIDMPRFYYESETKLYLIKNINAHTYYTYVETNQPILINGSTIDYNAFKLQLLQSSIELRYLPFEEEEIENNESNGVLENINITNDERILVLEQSTDIKE